MTLTSSSVTTITLSITDTKMASSIITTTSLMTATALSPTTTIASAMTTTISLMAATTSSLTTTTTTTTSSLTTTSSTSLFSLYLQRKTPSLVSLIHRFFDRDYDFPTGSQEFTVNRSCSAMEVVSRRKLTITYTCLRLIELGLYM